MLRRSQPMKRTRMRTTPKRRSRSIVPPDVVEAVRVRDGGICQRCGVWLANVPAGGQHHRKPRARMGKHTLANLVSLCLICHDEVHTGDTRQAADDGWLLSATRNPADEAALTPEGWRYFTDDGRVLTPAQWRRERLGGEGAC